MKNLVIALCASLGLTSGCGGKTKSTSTPSPTTKQVQCYVGTTDMFSPDDKKVKTQSARIKRTLDPVANFIEENVDVSDDPTFPVGKTESFDVGMTVTSAVPPATVATFTMVERNAAFTGTGTLTGEPWQWMAWHSTSTMRSVGNTDANPAAPMGAITVESNDTLNGDTLNATKSIAMNGTVVMTTKESYQRVTCWQ